MDHNAYPNGVPVASSAGSQPLNESLRFQSSSIPRISSILAANIRSLLCKTDELQAVVDVYDPDIICISESWLKPTIPDSSAHLSNHILFCCDRPTHTGGVCTFVHSKIPCVRVGDFEDPDIESIWIKARPPRLPREVSMILVGTVYHPPSSCQEVNQRLLQHIQKNVEWFLQDHPEGLVFVCGYFNPTSSHIK